MEIFKSREIQNSILWSREKTPLATTPPPPILQWTQAHI